MAEAGDRAVLLVVDDDPVIRTLLRPRLARLKGVEVLEAADGEAALEVLGAHEVDLVLTDLLMPRMGGLELIREAGARGLRPDWIILSAVDTFDAAVEAIQLGAFDFIAKPPQLESLEVSVRNALGQRRLLRERERLFGELEETSRALAVKVRELEEKSEALRRDLERAEVIQRALLPREPPVLEGWCLNALYRPGRYVGGDLYHVARIGRSHLVLCVADATGHGVSSAMMSVLFHRRLGLTDGAGAPLAPALVLERVNRALLRDRPGAGVFLTAALCLVDLETGEATLAGAGHPPALLRTRSGEVRHLQRTGPALGLVEGAHYDEVQVRIGPGDRLLLFTDGLLQGMNGGDRWTPLHETLAEPHASGAARLEALVDRLAPGSATADDLERDDVTALLLEATPGASSFENRPGASAEQRRMPPRKGSPVLWYGERGDRAFLAVRGRGAWTEAGTFTETVEGILETGRPLTVLLGGCTHMDSTFLGTVHELVAEHPDEAKGVLELAEVTPALRRDFEELGMDEVLERTLEAAPEPPDEMQPLQEEPSAKSDSRLRVLRAHEALASLSARNRQRFLAVVETLRAELGE